MKNLVIVGISDTADRIARFVERYSLYNIIGCTVNKEYIPEGAIENKWQAHHNVR